MGEPAVPRDKGRAGGVRVCLWEGGKPLSECQGGLHPKQKRQLIDHVPSHLPHAHSNYPNPVF